LSLELKTELLMAIENYESRDMRKWDSGLDITALDNRSNDKILLRMITEPGSKSGYVGADTVDKMAAIIQNEDYDKGILIGDKFTKAAEKKLLEEGIQRISENLMLDFPPERLYSAARAFVDDQCKARCGRIPQKEPDCKGHLNGRYSCEVRLISDNVSFHFERGWSSLLEKDVLRLVSLSHSAID
jgi:hypothetical protein